MCIISTPICFVNSVKVLAGAEIWMLEAAGALGKLGVDSQFIAAPGSPLATAAIAAGFPTTTIPIRFDAAPWTFLKLFHHFRKRNFSAVICNQIKDLKAAGPAARLAGIEKVLLTRESDFPLRRRFYYRWYLGVVATGILVNSESTRRTTLQSAPWLSPKRIHLHYKGVDTTRYGPAGHTPDFPVVGFAGQLIERKGLSVLMQAWELIAEMDQRTRLQIIGDGPLAGRLMEWRQSLREPDRVLLQSSTRDMPAFYHGLSLLVLPSSQEGYGLVAAEAASCGLPVVASDVSSLPELVIDGRTGILVPVGDARALAEAVTGLLADPARAADLGRAGRDYMLSDHDREYQIRDLAKLLA